MEHILRNTVLTALEQKDATMMTIYYLLTDKTYRKGVTDKLNDPMLKHFWNQEFNSLASSQKTEMITPITNKLGLFLTFLMTRNILGTPKSTLDLDDVMNSGKILICDLSKGKIGEDIGSFLGSLLVAKLQISALRRVHIPEEKRKDFFLYIDEFQNFATETFVQILSEARKYRLDTVLAHQTTAQIDRMLLQIILANAGTIISFLTNSPNDEDLLLPIFSPDIAKHDISNLPLYTFYIRINSTEIASTFTGKVAKFDVSQNEEIKRSVIEASRHQYGVTIDTQEEEPKKPEITTSPPAQRKVSKEKTFTKIEVQPSSDS
ncbi:type IV secretory system conjugative DNA transfer family protein [Candidatus Roizmanbacteria bacterium]|nr:type IV secretory system conjugative DNA transfer family protein [Candidatus Roizmanbacteria bacterium]